MASAAASEAIKLLAAKGDPEHLSKAYVLRAQITEDKDRKLADFDNMGALQMIQAEGFVKGTVNRWPELQELGTGNEALVHDPRFYPVLQQDADIGGHERNLKRDGA